jgi:hypothetical protein
MGRDGGDLARTSPPPSPEGTSPVSPSPVTPAENSVPEMTILSPEQWSVVGWWVPTPTFQATGSGGARKRKFKAPTITWKSWSLTALVNYADNLAKAEGRRI